MTEEEFKKLCAKLRKAGAIWFNDELLIELEKLIALAETQIEKEKITIK